MAYPQVPAAYGFQPRNLLGGQVFSGSTRNVAIQYNYGTSIFYGDAIKEVNGFVTRASIASATTANQTTGVFLGCYFTSPATKQRLWSQYYPANTLAGDITAIISDDPDIVIKSVMLSSGSVIGSAAQVMIGSNVGGITTNTGNVATGDSASGILVPTALSTATLPFRVVDIVRDTAVNLGTVVFGSGASTTLTVSALPSALVIGTDVGTLDANGQLIQSGSYVSAAAAAGSTSVTINAAPTTAFVAGSTMVFTQYPEVLVKFNFGYHGYYSATAV